MIDPAMFCRKLLVQRFWRASTQIYNALAPLLRISGAARSTWARVARTLSEGSPSPP